MNPKEPVTLKPLFRIGLPPGRQPAPPWPPAPPPRRRPPSPWLMWAPVAVMSLLLGIVLAGWLAAGLARTRDAQPEPETFSVRGHVTLNLGGFVWDANPDVCAGAFRYGDIRLGTPVVVTDQAGTVVGTGTLGLGEPQRDPNDASRATACRVQIIVDGVPTDRQFYGVKIGDREKRDFNRFDIRQPLEISLD